MTEFQKDKVKNYLEEIENIIDDLRPKINGFDGLEKDIMQSVLYLFTKNKEIKCNDFEHFQNLNYL